jgi:hypothetical protein
MGQINARKENKTDYWSIELHTLKRNLSVWCQFKARKKRDILSTALIARTTDLGLGLKETMTKDEIKVKVEEIRKEVKKIHVKSAERRDAMLLELANMADDADESKKANAIRQMKRTERRSRVHGKLNFQRNRTHNGGGITRLQVPQSWPTMEEYNDNQTYALEDPKTTNQKDPHNWREVNCPNQIEFLIRLRNQRHFGQAETEGTRFTTEYMKHTFNWSASRGAAELVLRGEYENETISEISRQMLDNMTRVTEVDEIKRYGENQHRLLLADVI